MGNMIPHPSARPAMPAVALILSRYDRQKLASFIEVAISLLDTLDGDPEAEPATWTEAGNRNTHADLPDDLELSGDEKDTGWTEWQSRGRHKQTAGGYEQADQHEDDEDEDPDTSAEDASEGFDPEEDMCLAGDDRVMSGPVSLYGNRVDTGPGEADDGEMHQMEHDVPCIPVVTLEPNIFNGQRQLLGYTLPRLTRDGMEPEL
jgi:hypothetical protein